MKELLTSFALACAALALFWTLLFPKAGLPSAEIPRPLSTETAAAGHAALARWLGREGVAVIALRRRFDALTALPGAPRTGNLLVIALPEQTPVGAAEMRAVEDWVRAGNTLLLVAALDDTPNWAAGVQGDFVARLQRLARLEFRAAPAPPQAATPQTPPEHRLPLPGAPSGEVPASPALTPVARHPLTRGITRLATATDLPASTWQALPMDSQPVIVLFRRADSGAPALWLRPLGAGAILTSAWASPFANAQLGREDNARFLAGVVGWSLGPGGAVILDDTHQGASELYDPRQFFADPRLHRTLAWLVALWFAWVLLWRPLRPAPLPAAGPDDTALLRVAGGFLAHVLRPADAARELLAQYSNALRRRLGLPETGEPPWDWLATRARVEPARLEELRRVHARVAAGRRVDLRRLHDSLVELTGRLT